MLSIKPVYKCPDCYHSGLTMCDLNRAGWPLAGNWCSAFTPKQEAYTIDKAIQTPESTPSVLEDDR